MEKLLCFFLLALPLWPLPLFANSESEIRTPGGHDPYLIVIADESGGSKREPGIYGRTSLGRWRLLVKGNVVGGKTTSGVVTFLDLTALDSRYETMVIIDGKLYVFHVNARPDDPDTILQIGGKKAPARDLFYPNRVIELPKIKSVDEMSIFQLPVDEAAREQAMLISVKMEEPAFDGSKGVTLLVVMKAGRTTSKRIELARDPTVVDYHYYSSGNLRSLISGRGGKVQLISRLLFEHFAQPQQNDSPELAEWRKKLARYVASLSGRLKVTGLPGSYPYLRVSTGIIESIGRLQTEVQVTADVSLFQIYDPITGQRGLNHPDREEEPIFDFVGEVDRDPKGNFLMHPAEGEDVENASLVYINGELHFFLNASDSNGDSGLLQFKISDASEPHADKLAFHVITSLEDREDEADAEALPAIRKKGKSEANKGNFHLLFSTRRGKRSQTEVFILKPDFDSHTLQVLKRGKISDKFYKDDELSYRTHIARGAVLFDEVTPGQKTEGGYDQMYDDTVAHLNVAESMPKKPVYGYLKAKEVQSVVLDTLDYFIFNEEGARAKALKILRTTGLYFKRPTAGMPEKLLGQLLVADWKKEVDDDDKVLFSEEITLSSGTRGRLVGIALDKGYEGGKSSFTVELLFIYRNSEKIGGLQSLGGQPSQEGDDDEVDDEEEVEEEAPGATSEERVLLLDEIKFQMPFRALQAVEAFPGKKKTAGNVSILFSTEPSGRQKGGVWSYSYVFEGGGKQVLTAKSISSNVRLSEEPVVASEMVARFFIDEAGHLYWVKEPQKSPKDADFSLMSLRDGSPVLLNSSTGRTLSLRSVLDSKKEGEGGEDGEGFSMDRYSSATWRVWSEYGVEKRIERFDQLEDAASKRRVKKKEEVAEETDEEANEEEGEAAEEEKRPDPRPLKRDQRPRKNVHARMAEVYPNLTTLLGQLADPREKPQHKILLVPDDQREHLVGYILKLWAEGKALQGNLLPPTFPWVRENDNLKLYVLDATKSGQDDFWENFKDMDKQRNTDRAVVLVDMNDLSAVARPQMRDSEEEPFVFNEVIADDGQTIVKGEALPPHGAYLLASEGRRWSLAEFQKRAAQKNISILLVGSRPNLERVMHDSTTEGRAGLWSKEHFDPPISYYHGSWRLWGPHTTQVSPIVEEVSSHGVSKYREKIFSDLERIIKELADPSIPAKHRLLIVPPEIKEFVESLLIARWSDEKLGAEPWHFKNPALRVFMLSNEVEAEGAKKKGSAKGHMGQELIFENLDIIRSLPAEQRAVVLADLEEVIQLGRPVASNPQYDEFQLTDLSIADAADEKNPALDAAPADIEEQAFPPHMLYLLATEGERVSLKEFQQRDPKASKKIPMLLIGTEGELERIQRDISIENHSGLLKDFEVVHLSLPDHMVRRAMLKQALNRPEIRNLGYRFDARTPDASGAASGNMPTDQERAQDELLAYMVSFCERLAVQNKMNVLTAFLKMFQAFNAALVRDEELRDEKIVDRRFVQRLMASIFRVQLNPSLLPKDDPLVLIQDESDIALRVEAAGYKGPFDLTTQTVRVLSRQTEPNPKLPIPASLLAFGESGSGKTSLVLALIKVFFDEPHAVYDFKNPNHPGARAFVLNCRKLVEKDAKAKVAEGEMTVEEAFRHLDHFLTLPNGARGLILLDDIHAPGDPIRNKLLAKIQTLVGSEDGMWRGVSAFAQGPDRGEVKEVPLQNVMLFATANPTYDQEKLKRFQKDRKKPPTTEELILASLSTEDQQLDLSFLFRWGGILRLDVFDSQAKTPAVLAEARSGAQPVFNNQNRLILVSPESAELIRQRFPNANARTFLAQTSPALLAASNRVHSSSPLHIVVPRDVKFRVRKEELGTDNAGGDRDSDDLRNRERDDEDEWDGEEEGEDTGGHPSQLDTSRNLAIETFIQEHIQALPVADSFEGNLELLRLMVGSFRSYLLENMIKSLRRDMRFAKDPHSQHLSLAPFLHATHAHLWVHPGLPLSDLNLDPKEFGATNRSLEERFKQALQLRDVAATHPFAKWIFSRTRNDQLLPLLSGEVSFLTVARSRRDILVETEQILRQWAQGFLQLMVGVESLDHPPESRLWLSKLKPPDPLIIEEAVKQVGTFYLDFLARLYDGGLLENERPGEYATITTYDAARLFLMTLDRAIARLSWAKTESFVTRSLLQAANDLSLGELPGFQNYVFRSPDSILVPRTIDLPLQIASSSEIFREWAKGDSGSEGDETTVGKPERLATRFLDECERMFQRPKTTGTESGGPR